MEGNRQNYPRKDLGQLCECGCGAWTNSGCRFIHGHNSRVEHPFKGRKHTEEARRGNSEAHRILYQDPKNHPSYGKGKKKEVVFCECGCGQLTRRPGRRFVDNHYWRTEEAKLLASEREKEHQKVPEVRENASRKTKEYYQKHPEKGQEHSEKIVQLYVEGKMDNVGFGKSGYFFSIKNRKNLHYRSSYELLAYEILEQLSKVKEYQVTPFWIPYEFEGKKRNTIPDILVTYTDGTKELIEVKASHMLKDEKTQAKIQTMNDYATNHGWDFGLWTEKELSIH